MSTDPTVTEFFTYLEMSSLARRQGAVFAQDVIMARNLLSAGHQGSSGNLSTVNIGEAARRSGVNAKLIRHYELIGLVRSERRANNYRAYTEQTVAMLRFIHHARELALPLEEVKALLGLWSSGTPLEVVQARAEAEVKRLESKAASVAALAASLRDLARTTEKDRPRAPRFDDVQPPRID
ncbi:MerR family transcriptional regulator [Sabulicella glaciei]|uniref:MerR family transcriptional regulator n=1 Tax=Sabulicella glaciei TaxID=2984948 RepID=A0ABT3NWR8_9PROT|nr:MerR family transcriptional regulator [Roseococcus sp. MDT2-1-1]MCW8086601.1 MerR family transcriptional regulator [Roseococcus sp. MDT2-1-1]